MNAVSEIEPTVEIADNTPGGMLRRQREQRALTVQQVSEELHLDAWLVEALEENRFLALGAPVYAKGHLRKYAVLLGLSPELILARYQVIAQPLPLPPPPPEALITPPAPASRLDWSRMDWRIYAIIGGLMLMVTGLAWLLGQSSGTAAGSGPKVAEKTEPAASTPSLPDPEPVAAAPEVAPTVAAPVRSERAPTATTAKPIRAPLTAAATPPAAKVQQAPVKTAASPPGIQPRASVSALIAASNVQEPATAAAAVPQPKSTAPPGTQIAKVPTPSSAPVAAAPVPEEAQVSLRLEFSSASWAEVYDGDGRRVLYAVGDPSRPRTISGKPPLKVILGTAGSVQARVNGRPIAIPRRIGQDSASFTVNANGSIRQPGR